MRLEYLDLLPLGEFEREDFRAEHLELARRLEQGARQQRARTSDPQRDRKGAKERRPADDAGTLAADLAELRTLLRPYGLSDAVLLAMARAPQGEGRVERYSHHLVLLLDDLTPEQRRIFERVVPEVDGAYLAAQALRDRTELALKQADLDERQTRGVLDGFRRQTRVLETRFWQLVDYVLEDEQKARLWELLPSSFRRHASPEDHVYALPTLEPAQGARVKALITEIQAESAPDEALVRRRQKAARDSRCRARSVPSTRRRCARPRRVWPSSDDSSTTPSSSSSTRSRSSS